MSDRLLRAREVAELLGMSTAWVLDKWETGALPGHRISSRAIRFREADVLAWLDARYVASRDVESVSCGEPDRGVR